MLIITYGNTWCHHPKDCVLIYSLPKMTINCRPTNLGTQSTDNSFIKKLKSSGRSLVVFYGSQTGTGEEFAGRLAKEGIRYHLKGMVADPEECEMVSRMTNCLLSEIAYFHNYYKFLSCRVCFF
jgi:sulfite reductase alpha subunit-like flavoprotein